MGVIIAIFSFVWRVLRAVLPFIVSIPGLVITALVGVVVFVSLLASDVYGVVVRLVEFFDTAQTFVEEMVSVIAQQTYWGFFYELFAIDTFGQVFTYFISLVSTLIVLIVFEVVFQGIVVAVPFMIYKSIGKLIQTISGGFSKPA